MSQPSATANSQAQAERLAIIERCLSIQLDALIKEYGAVTVLHAAASSLHAASAYTTTGNRSRIAGIYLAVADAMRFAARDITRISS